MGRTASRVPSRSTTSSTAASVACRPSPCCVVALGVSPGPGAGSPTVGRGLDQEPGVLARATEGGGLDRRPGGPVLPEPLGPDLVEDRPVPLQVAHDDA